MPGTLRFTAPMLPTSRSPRGCSVPAAPQVSRSPRALDRTGRASRWVVACLVTSLSCDGGNADDSGEEPAGIEIAEDNNYTATSVLNLPTIATAAGQDVELCFDQVTTDLQCHEIDPGEDIAAVVVTKFVGRTKDEIEAFLGQGMLETTDVVAVYKGDVDGETCVSLSEMTGFSADVKFEVETEYTPAEGEEEVHYVAVFGSRSSLSSPGAITLAFIEPTEGETNDVVNAVPGCDPSTDPPMLVFTPDIASAEPLEVPEDGPWVIGWGDIETDGLGNEFAPLRPDRLLLGFYEGATPADLEENIFNLESMATEMWELTLDAQDSADLTTAIHREDDSEFEGFSDYGDGTWIVAILDSTAQNPAPQILTVLDPS